MAAPRLAAEDGGCCSPQPPPTHYDVLGLAPSMLDSGARDASALVKQAYRRALLRHHPDKTPPAPSARAPAPAPAYTVDQISQALAVLCSPAQRAAYDASLRLGGPRTPSAAAAPRFHTGLENVDLDDLCFDDASARWHRSCRCGNDRGYSFDEADLMDAADDGLLMVGCQDCSLWLRVHFALVDDEEHRETDTSKP